jgi:shikimate kinase
MMITLTGFMGSGKTTVGKVLADFLGCPFMDLDDLVVKKAGKSIPDIFAQDGEPAFRELEARLLRQTVEKYAESTVVLALGGGAILAPASAALLHDKTVCIYLRATLDTLLARLAGETAGRPLLQEIPDQVGKDDEMTVMPGPDRASVAARLAAREPLYEETAHVTIDTDGLTPDEVADEIIISCL